MRSKKWWEEGLQIMDTPFISVLEKIEHLITKETTRFKKPNPTLKPIFVFHLDINLETNYPS